MNKKVHMSGHLNLVGIIRKSMLADDILIFGVEKIRARMDPFGFIDYFSPCLFLLYIADQTF